MDQLSLEAGTKIWVAQNRLLVAQFRDVEIGSAYIKTNSGKDIQTSFQSKLVNKDPSVELSFCQIQKYHKG